MTLKNSSRLPTAMLPAVDALVVERPSLCKPSIPGIRRLPATDMDGRWHIVDGDNDGDKTVDRGAYELQGQ